MLQSMGLQRVGLDWATEKLQQHLLHVCGSGLVTKRCWILFNPMDCSLPGSSSPGKNTGVGCHALLQGIFLTQGSKETYGYRKKF